MNIGRSSFRPPSIRLLLRLNNDALELFEDGELLVRRVNFRISLLFPKQKSYLLKALQLALDITRVFLDKLGKAANVRVEIRILCVYYYYFSSHSGCNKNV